VPARARPLQARIAAHLGPNTTIRREQRVGDRDTVKLTDEMHGQRQLVAKLARRRAQTLTNPMELR